MAATHLETSAHAKADELTTTTECGHIEVKSQTYDKDAGDINTERLPEARGRDVSEVPKGYWWSPGFLGSIMAIAFAMLGASGGFALIAPLLSDINADIGPSKNITWVSLIWLLTQTVTTLLAGRLTDVFGRRWFFISGSAVALIGSIFASRVQTVNQLIGAMVLLGLSSGVQLSFFWTAAELVPMKYRYLANAFMLAFTFPTNPLAPKIALTIQAQTSVKWRGCFYFMIAINAVSVACWYFFYHPPTFKMLHRNRLLREVVLRFDWIGLVLFTGSILIFLMGLQWGGNIYAWHDAHVIGTLVVGAIGVIVFVLWEMYLPIANAEPFLPLHLFRNLRYMSVTWLTAIGAAVYYGFGIVWPQAVATIYPGLDDSYKATLTGLVAMGFVFGQITGDFVATMVGPRIPIITCITVAGPILTACAADPLNRPLTMGLLIVGCLFIGAMEGMAIATATFPLRSQEEIGTAGGLSGAVRIFGGCVAVAIYSTVLNNRLATTVPGRVTPAAIGAGLPSSSIPALISGLQGETPMNVTNIPGLTDSIFDVASFAFRQANADAYKTVFYTSFAFSGIGMILCWFVAQNDASTLDFVAGHIHRREEEQELEAQ
ncbi:hypothetical protein CLAIMM_09483 [Cladophialophora immunda]|nr:hypothetical protein CLAIMM_09483 [Cladophialophora immunda]